MMEDGDGTKKGRNANRCSPNVKEIAKIRDAWLVNCGVITGNPATDTKVSARRCRRRTMIELGLKSEMSADPAWGPRTPVLREK